MEWIWFLVLIEYILLMYWLFHSFWLNAKERAGRSIEHKLRAFQAKRLETLKHRNGLKYAKEGTLEQLCQHVKLYPSYRNNEYQRLVKLYKFISKKLKAKGYKTIPPSVVISIIQNMIMLKESISWSKNMKDVPSLEEVAYMLHNNIDAGRIIKLYSEGLSISEIIETKDISEAHAVALYS